MIMKLKILLYGNPFGVIETNKKKLTFEQLQKFYKTCFNHFFNMNTIVHQGHLLRLLGLKAVEYRTTRSWSSTSKVSMSIS